MNKEQLKEQLEHLRAQLSQAEAADPQQRELLLTRAHDIEQLLKQEEIEPHHYRSLSERLNEDLAQLEASHPQITLLMRQAIDSLSYLGI
jgi:Domain of unknown function (DUF4404)